MKTPHRLPAAVLQSLHRVFGIRNLRDGQREVIARALAGQDTLAIMPTGAGKSLCYQLPALHLQGVTVVVSPLIALMKDQVGKLEAAGVAAEQINSGQLASEQGDALARIEGGEGRLVYATPERLTDPDFVAMLKAQGVGLFVVDEAHCISQWGHDFRPAFLELGQVVQELGKPPVLALTATAPPQVAADICKQLRRPRMQVVQTGMYRPNLRLQVAQCVREGDKLQQTLQALQATEGAGIIYCSSVKAATELHAQLLQAGVAATCYHGRLPRAERHASQDDFMAGRSRVMVATSAFGMGIDRADLRFVIHYQLPGSPEAYYQEAGRAGRDGQVADCALLFDRRDKQVQQFFLARRQPGADELLQLHTTLSEAPAPMQAKALQEALPQTGAARLAVLLHLLREAGLAGANRQRAWRALGGPLRLADFEAIARQGDERDTKDREALERMVFYAQTGFCRWRVLLEYFEEPLPFEGERCGLCDNCLRPPVAPDAAETEAAQAPVPSPQSRWQPGAVVSVPRYGSGLVHSASADEVEVQFPDGSLRRFVADYVQDGTPVPTS